MTSFSQKIDIEKSTASNIIKVVVKVEKEVGFMSRTVAVIGCGRIANNAHLPAFEKMGNVRVKYACDTIEEKAIAVKEKYDFVENAITDYRVALDDNEVEAVFVLTPNFMHYEITMAALKAGKHVMCEKPITINYELSCENGKRGRKTRKDT